MTSDVTNDDYFPDWRGVNGGLKLTNYAHRCRQKTSTLFVITGWSHSGTSVFHSANTYVPKNV